MKCSVRIFLLSKAALLFCLLTVLPYNAHSQQSWSEVSRASEGSITVYWYESRPFIYTAPRGQMAGIELELMQGFRKFVKDKHGVDLTINWKKAKSFNELYETIRDNNRHCIGTSAFSITENRKREVKFSQPYMSDITVLITSNDIPIVNNAPEFHELLPKLTAITIKRTTYEEELFMMRAEGKVPFKMKYIHSSENILKSIESMDSTYGFIDHCSIYRH